jgi:MarR family 2-MHQ and catechol resistance regulon transcriptional repressor
MKRTDGRVFRTPGHRLTVTTVRVAGRLAKAADRFLKPWRLSLAQFNLLAVLRDHPKGLPQSGIGAQLVVSRPNISGLVRRMEARALCRIGSDARDARVRRVRISPEGARLMDRIRLPYDREIRRLTRALSTADLDRAAAALERLESALS